MAETSEMESPSAHQGCLVEAKEDSTSVEAELVNASSSAMADMNGDAERGSVMVVCQRPKEGLEDEREPEEGRSNELARKPEEQEEEKEEEVELELKMSEEMSEESDAMSPMDPFRSDESSRVDDILDPRDQQATSSEKFSSSSRKRPADNDFLPINAEIKRIGIEISEEEATQLRNDVRRLSPVLVSLRERTLGEVSLTSKSCLLGDDNRTTTKDNGTSEGPISESSERGQLRQTDQDSRQFNFEEKEQEEKEEVRIDVTTQQCKADDGIIAEDLADCESSELTCDSQKDPLDFMVPSPVTPESNKMVTESSPDNDSCGAKTMNASNSPSPIFRRLTVMLNRIEETSVKKNSNENENCAKIEDSPRSSRRWSFTEEQQSSRMTAEHARENLKKPRSQNDSSPVTRSKKYKFTEEIRSPNSLRECKVILERIDNVQADAVMAAESPPQRTEDKSAAMIGKPGDDGEELALASSPVGNQASRELDSSEAMPSSPEVTPDASIDVAEGADTETETETGSDSSEVSPIASIRELRDVDVSAEHQLPCVEGEPLCCVETMAPIMTRLEAERPEAYTEDSAESLALATGARDEVRSDGSDSGLGNEIPGDPGPAPAPESDSETSFLDRLPDDILSDKEKGKTPRKNAFLENVNLLSGVLQMFLRLDYK